MVTEELLQFIRAQERRGKSREEITQMLLHAGWQETDIAAAWGKKEHIPVSSGKLPSIDTLLSETFSTYKRRFITLTGVALIGFLMQLGLGTIGFIGGIVFGAAGILLNLHSHLLILPLVLLFFILFLFVRSWSEVALLLSISEETGIFASFRQTRFLIFPFLAVTLLSDIVIIGGYLLFFVLGIIFSIWFLFIKYIFLLEHQHGAAPLYQSREYVRGKWGEVAGKFIIFPLILCLVVGGLSLLDILFTHILGNQQIFVHVIVVILYYLCSILVIPVLVALYTFTMYRFVKKPIQIGVTGKRTKLGIWVAAAFGVIAIALLVLLGVLIYRLFPDGCLSPEPGQCSVQTNNMLSTQQRDEREKAVFQAYLESYHNRYGAYPQNIIAVIPASGTFERQMVTSGGIVYQSLQSGQNYTLCIRNLPGGCITTHHPTRAVMPTHFEPQASGEATPK